MFETTAWNTGICFTYFFLIVGFFLSILISGGDVRIHIQQPESTYFYILFLRILCFEKFSSDFMAFLSDCPSRFPRSGRSPCISSLYCAAKVQRGYKRSSRVSRTSRISYCSSPSQTTSWFLFQVGSTLISDAFREETVDRLNTILMENISAKDVTALLIGATIFMNLDVWISHNLPRILFIDARKGP